MSDITKSKINLGTAICCAVCICGWVGSAVFVKADVESLKAGQAAMKAQQSADHDAILLLQGDLKALLKVAERIERKIQ